MGKHNLGKSTISVSEKVKNGAIFIREDKADVLVNDIAKQFDAITSSLNKINGLLNRSVSIGAVKGSKAATNKAWAKKSKEQANNAEKLKAKMLSKYALDLKNYPIQLLDLRISELEKKIAELEK